MRIGAKALVAGCAAIGVMNVFAAGTSSAASAVPAARVAVAPVARAAVVPNTPPLADGTRFHESGGSAEYISWFGASLPLSSGDARAYSAEGNKAVSTVAAGYVAAHPASDFPANKAFRIVGSLSEYLNDGEEILPLATNTTTCLTNLGQAHIAVVPDLWARPLIVGPATACAKPAPEGPFTFLQSYSPPTSEFGFGGDTITGDFNGDGKADVLVYGEGSGPSQLWYGTDHGFELGPQITVNGDYLPVVGDFNGDGRDDILWDASANECLGDGCPSFTTSVWYGRPNNAGFLDGPKLPTPPQGEAKTIHLPGGGEDGYFTAQYLPVIGDFNGDGKDDVYWFLEASVGAPPAPNELWYGATLGFTEGSKSTTPVPPILTQPGPVRGTKVSIWLFPPGVGDFNGDGRDDILWYGPGVARLWRGTTGAFANVTIPKVYGLYEPFVGDFNGDGKADVFWYGPGTKPDALWRGTAGGFANGPGVSVKGRYEPLVGDFNGDGKADIYWSTQPTFEFPSHVVTANDYTWFGGASGFTHSTPITQTVSQDDFASPAVGDFNGDGKADLLWSRDNFEDNGPGAETVDLWRAH